MNVNVHYVKLINLSMKLKILQLNIHMLYNIKLFYKYQIINLIFIIYTML
jgi:hypothetical protein